MQKNNISVCIVKGNSELTLFNSHHVLYKPFTMQSVHCTGQVYSVQANTNNGRLSAGYGGLLNFPCNLLTYTELMKP